MIDPTLPFIDLHRHLDGSLRLQTILDLATQHGIELPARDVESLRPHIEVLDNEPDLMAFIGRFKWLTKVLVDAEACRRVAYENVEDAKLEGIDYIELRFSPWFMAETHGLDPAAVTEAVVEGAEAASQETGVVVNLIGILSRTYGTEIAWKELDALLTQRDHLVALDLAGDEAGFPAELFVDHFKRGRDAGWQVTIHAGEAAGSESIWTAIRQLGATRIGHAVRADEDPELIDYLIDQGIGVEANLTSNVQTSTVPSYEAHPLADQLKRGVKATINTDDPTISGIDLRYEFEIAAPKAGITPELARQAQEHALDIAFLSKRQKTILKSRESS